MINNTPLNTPEDIDASYDRAVDRWIESTVRLRRVQEHCRPGTVRHYAHVQSDATFDAIIAASRAMYHNGPRNV